MCSSDHLEDCCAEFKVLTEPDTVLTARIPCLDMHLGVCALCPVNMNNTASIGSICDIWDQTLLIYKCTMLSHKQPYSI